MNHNFDDSHVHDFTSTSGQCICGEQAPCPPLSGTAGPWPRTIPPLIPYAPVNGGSPVGPGFVVFERAPGARGYDHAMALKSVGPGWRTLIDVLFDKVEHDKKWNPDSGLAHLVVT